VITDAGGGIRARHDYLPFGEEIGGRQVSLKGGRDPNQYLSENLRQQFTGKERDSESGLDYFLARDYQSGHGRFTSVDPLLASAQAGNPQTFNRYAYAGNNPLKFIDPSGMNYFVGGSGAGDPFITEYRTDGFEQSPEGTTSQLDNESMMTYSPSILGQAEAQTGGGTATVYLDSPNRNDNAAFANRAKDLTPQEGGLILTYESGWDLINKLKLISQSLGSISTVNIIGHAFPPGMLGTGYQGRNGLFIEDRGNPAYNTNYTWRDGTTHPPHYDTYFDAKKQNIHAGLETTSTLAQAVGKSQINIAPNGKVNFYGCNTFRLASHLSYLLGLNGRSDITVSGTKGSCYLGGGRIRPDEWQTYQNGIFIPRR
jgi:RHS repeat-associated protein